MKDTFLKCMNMILSKVPMTERGILRVHSDCDPSIIGGDLMQYLMENKMWQTHTEGYDHNANARVENRIGRTRRAYRTALMAATGGRGRYKDVVGAEHVAPDTSAGRVLPCTVGAGAKLHGLVLSRTQSRLWAWFQLAVFC